MYLDPTFKSAGITTSPPQKAHAASQHVFTPAVPFTPSVPLHALPGQPASILHHTITAITDVPLHNESETWHHAECHDAGNEGEDDLPLLEDQSEDEGEEFDAPSDFEDQSDDEGGETDQSNDEEEEMIDEDTYELTSMGGGTPWSARKPPTHDEALKALAALEVDKSPSGAYGVALEPVHGKHIRHPRAVDAFFTAGRGMRLDSSQEKGTGCDKGMVGASYARTKRFICTRELPENPSQHEIEDRHRRRAAE
ncbi:hypothetical protein HGRIS_005256 [Hohenbuehelia grisea]|uniref:Uncharacterized protein n=1 Tax=Hohenbuehelia grisea TaxID=104357 RepID=A0ABR3JEF4_9AGAR